MMVLVLRLPDILCGFASPNTHTYIQSAVNNPGLRVSSSFESGLGSEVVMRLSRLVFSVHRPTVAALMSLGTDMAAAAAAAPAAAAAAGGDALGNVPEGIASQPEIESGAYGVPKDAKATEAMTEQVEHGEHVVLAGAQAPAAAAPHEQPQQQRSSMRMVFEMEQLEVCAAQCAVSVVC
eukprot:1151483-Pelagomonas_calceolata.AAC.1